MNLFSLFNSVKNGGRGESPEPLFGERSLSEIQGECVEATRTTNLPNQECSPKNVSRRGFLKTLGLVAGAAVAAPLLTKLPTTTYILPETKIVSATTLSSAIDPAVEQVARELSYRLAYTVNMLMAGQLDGSGVSVREIRKVRNRARYYRRYERIGERLAA
jgi:hypothetical protein